MVTIVIIIICNIQIGCIVTSELAMQIVVSSSNLSHKCGMSGDETMQIENAMEKWLNDINDTCDSHMTCTSLDLCDLMLFQYHTQYEYKIKFIC